jgi:hypothetical protein
MSGYNRAQSAFFIVLLMCLSATSTNAESSISILSLLGSHIPHVARPLESKLKAAMDDKVVCILKNGGCATATIVDGCLISAAHVFNGIAYPVSIYAGKTPDFSQPPIATIKKGFGFLHPDYKTFKEVAFNFRNTGRKKEVTVYRGHAGQTATRYDRFLLDEQGHLHRL